MVQPRTKRGPQATCFFCRLICLPPKASPRLREKVDAGGQHAASSSKMRAVAKVLKPQNESRNNESKILSSDLQQGVFDYCGGGGVLAVSFVHLEACRGCGRSALKTYSPNRGVDTRTPSR